MSSGLNFSFITIAGLAFAACAAEQPYLHAPSVETYAQHDPVGLTILSSGRHLKPAGRHLPVARFPYGLAMSRDGKTLFVASDGVGQIISGWQGTNPAVAVVNPPAYKGSRKNERPTNAGGA